jgi:hypothetical protein
LGAEEFGGNISRRNGKKHQAPSTKHQRSTNLQAPNFKPTQISNRSTFFLPNGIWSLELGISLELGGWYLELGAKGHFATRAFQWT